MAQIQRAFTAWKRIDETVAPLEDTNRRLIDEIHELLDNVQARVDRIESDPVRIREMEDRLNLIHSLKRKYASGALAGLDEVIARGERSAAELASLESGGESQEKMEKRLKAVQAEVSRLGAELTEARKGVAGPLAEKITGELQVLGFKKASLKIEFQPVSGPMGFERAEFMFAPNLGETPRPLRAIASSGEMARVMLAHKTTLAEVDQVPILIFDEVDANVGGETAMEVGKKMRGLGDGHQVLCITHLPQVASQGQHHFAVEKVIQGGRTSTALRFLERGDREREIARMLGGQTEAALALAKTLLDAAG
jgi:DNA repair protein RecN (Recombination protein N)